MESLPNTLEQEELVIDTVEGLVGFLAYANEAFADFEEATSSCSSEEQCAPYQKSATEAYEKIQSLVERHCKVLDYGGFLSEDDVEEIQSLYNKIVSAEDALSELFVNQEATQASTETAKDEEDAVATEETPLEVNSLQLEEHEDSAELDEPVSSFGWSKPVLVSEKGTVTIVDESEPESMVSIKQTLFDTETIRMSLKEINRRAETILAAGEAKLHEYKSISEEDSTGDDTKNGVDLYRELENKVREVRELFAVVRSYQTGPITEERAEFVATAQAALDDFEMQLPIIDTSLSWFFEEPQAELEEAYSQSKELPTAVNDNEKFNNIFKPNLFSKNEMRPFIEAVTTVPEYKSFLASHFTSPGAFEAYLRRQVLKFDEPSKFDRWFGVERKSPFDTLLRDMTVSQVDLFEKQSGAQLEKILREKEIEYRAYVEWMKEFEAIKEIFKPHPEMTFGELFVMTQVEDLMHEAEKKAA